MTKLTKRQRKILNGFINSKDYIKGDYIAQSNQISVKTVQREIKEINNFLNNYNCEINSKRGQGYKFEYNKLEDVTVLKSIVEEIDCKLTYILEENRVDWLIRKLALLYIDSENEAIKLEELGDELFISLSTVKSDLNIVKEILKEYDLNIERNGNLGIYIEGEETKFRYFLSDYLVHKMNLKKVSTIFGIIDDDLSAEIRRIIVETINNYNLNITDLGFDNLYNHIVIAITRIKNNKFIDDNNKNVMKSEDSEYEASEYLCRNIYNLLNIEFPQSEVTYIYQHLKSQNRLFKDDNYTLEKEDYKNLIIIRDSLIKIYEEVGIDFTKDEILEKGLLVHLNSVLNRIKYKMNIRNNLLEEIKKNYVFAYELGDFLAKEIGKSLEISIDENETGYLALHFGGALERMNIKERKEKLKVIIVCASGMGTSILLKSKLINRFGSKINIIGVYPSYKLDTLNLEEIDLILSTIDLEYKTLPIIKISPILDDQDLKKINHFLKNGNKNYSVNIKNYFKEELFIESLDKDNYLDVVEYMSERLYKLGYIDDVMKNSYIDREKMSSTEIGNMVAIPHAIVGKVKKSCIFVAILKNPIKWFHTEVQLVMMLAIDKNVLLEHENIFLDIYEPVNELYKVKEIVNNRSLDYIKKQY